LTFEGIQLTNYMAVSVGTILVYDFLIMLSEEVDYLWMGNRILGLGKALYILTRYSAFPTLILVLVSELGTGVAYTACTPLFYAHAASETAAIIFSEGLFALRTYILWNCHKFVFAILSTLMTSVLVSVGIILGFSSSSVTFVISSDPNISACTLGSPPRLASGIYLVTLVGDNPCSNDCSNSEKLATLSSFESHDT